MSDMENKSYFIEVDNNQFKKIEEDEHYAANIFTTLRKFKNMSEKVSTADVTSVNLKQAGHKSCDIGSKFTQKEDKIESDTKLALEEQIVNSSIDISIRNGKTVHKLCDREMTQKQEKLEGNHIWSDKETILLISVIKENPHIFKCGMSTSKIWEYVSNELRNIGKYNISAKKCQTKYDALLRTYRGIKDNNRTSGRGRVTWKHFTAMDDLMKDKPSIKPLSVAGSHINANQSDVAVSEYKVSKKRKGSELLEQLIEEKQQFRKQKAQQHKEKMALLNEIKNKLFSE